MPPACSIVGTMIYNPASQSPCLSRTPHSQSIAALASSPPWLTSSPRRPGPGPGGEHRAHYVRSFSLNQLRTHPWSGGGAGGVFVVFSHPQRFLSSYCVPPESTHRHCLEIRSSVGRDVRRSLGDFFNLKMSFNSSSNQS